MTEDYQSESSDPMLTYHEFAAELGRIASQAAKLETQLAELFYHIMGADAERGLIGYWFLPTFDQRRRLMEKVLDSTELPFDAEARRIIRRSKKFLRFRNGAVHNLWRRVDPGDSPMERITVNTVRCDGPETVTIKLKEMREKVETAVKLNADLETLLGELEQTSLATQP